jgi:hypothetical protein
VEQVEQVVVEQVEQQVDAGEGTAGTVNTGGGGGGSGGLKVDPVSAGANGGSGIIIIRAPGSANLGSKSRHKYSNYITSPSRRLQSSYIYSIRNINNINDYVLSF